MSTIKKQKLFSIAFKTKNSKDVNYIRYLSTYNEYNKLVYNTITVKKITDASYYTNLDIAKEKAKELNNKYKFSAIFIEEKNSGRISKIKFNEES